MGTPKQDDFADLLRRFRLRAGLSQEALAERAGLSTNGVGGLERGIRTLPHADTVGRLGDALGLSAGEREAFAAAARPPRTTERATGAEEHIAVPLPGSGAVPEPPTLMIGRGRELAEAVALLGRAEVRLLTLSGPGGVGKTRLALATAAAIRADGRFRDGVIFVDLAPIREPSLVVTAIARALGVAESGAAAPATRVFEHLKARQVLLVLDNFEHLLEAAPVVSDLLAACPLVKILVTSRVRLRLRGERVLIVPPLSLPDENEGSANELAASDAVRLLADRMADADPSFAVTEKNAAAMAAICRRLDGLPLALELVAPWARLLQPEELRRRLEEGRLPAAVAAADLPPRQQTMRNTIAWSYELLEPGERAVLRSLSVFSGGWTLEAAEAVVSVAEGESGEVLLGLAGLVEQSLVHLSDPSGDGNAASQRFSMFETVREFAQDRLEEHGHTVAARTRHVAFFLALVARAEPELQGPNQVAWLDALERDHANLRVALSWLLEEDAGGERLDDGLRLATGLWPFWTARGYLNDRRIWLEQAVRTEVDPPTPMFARALLYLANTAYDLCENERAAVLYNRSLTAWTSLGDERGVIVSIAGIGIVARNRGDLEAARRNLFEGLRRADRISNEPNRIASMLFHLGEVAIDEGNLEHARFAIQQARDIWETLGHVDGVAFCDMKLGTLLGMIGNEHDALVALERAAAAFTAADDRRSAASTKHALARLARDFGRLDDAIPLCQAALKERVRLEDDQGIVESLELVAVMAVTVESELALRLWAVAESWRKTTGTVPSPAEARNIDRHRQAARSHLGERDAARVMEEGASMRLGQAAFLAHRYLNGVEDGGGRNR